MKKHLLIAIILLAGLLYAQEEVFHSFPLPQLMNPIYDGFTKNYTVSSAAGSAFSGISKMGGVQQIILNPAAAMMDEASVYLDLSIKPPLSEIDNTFGASYTSPIPFGMFAVGGRLNEKLNAALIYSVPKSIVYDDFSMELGQGISIMQRYPTYYLHQITANIAYHQDKLNVGLSLHNQIHYLDDILILRTFDRIRRMEYVLRPELGMLYSSDLIGLGFTIIPEHKLKIDTPYYDYEGVLPLQIAGGMSFTKDNHSISLAAEFEQNSEASDAYDDRLSWRAGYEIRIRRFTYRIGYINHPGVFEGDFIYPANPYPGEDESLYWNDVPIGGTIANADQHLLTAGATLHHKAGTVNVSVIQDIADNLPLTQINLSLSMYLRTFKSKGFQK